MSSYSKTPLGQSVGIPSSIDRKTLCPIERKNSNLRSSKTFAAITMQGKDIWNCYELSWLGTDNVPQIGLCQISYDCHSTFLVESKSLKLYLGSYYNTVFSSLSEVQKTIKNDLSAILDSDVSVEIFRKEDWAKSFSLDNGQQTESLNSVDEILDSENSKLIFDSTNILEERLSCDLFRSLCPVTKQPDWATVEIHYKAAKLTHASVLQYLLGYREHAAFHEEVCEQIFTDIHTVLNPEFLMVRCNFLRRGGIDINPIRHTPGYNGDLRLHRLIRQ